MNLLDRLAESIRAHQAVSELMKSELLSASTKFYLAQFRQLLEAEIAELQRQVAEAVIA